MDRSSATVLGVLFALFASEVAARSDDAPGELANRIRALLGDLLAWSATQLQSSRSDEPKDAPLTARILGLDETCTNAISERPALNAVKTWFGGIPTALLSLQSAVLSIRDAAGRGGTTPAGAPEGIHAIDEVDDFLRSNLALDLPNLRRQRASLAGLRRASSAQALATNEIIDALMYVLAGLEAILTLKPPDAPPSVYPVPTFAVDRQHAVINLIRTVVAVLLGYFIWDVTAWTHGIVFMIIITVAGVVLVTLEDPVVAIWAAIIGSTMGCLVGLGTKYFILIRANDPLNLLLVLFPIMFFCAWIETKGKLAPFGVVIMIGALFMIEPKNPQEYNFVNDVNTCIAIEFAFVFMALVFLAIAAPKKGAERLTQMLARMRQHRCSARLWSTRQGRLSWETSMYDELKRLQEATKDPRYRQHGVNLLLSGLKACQPLGAVPIGLTAN